MTKYIIRAAMRDEANEGWVWMDGHPSRTIVRITRDALKRSVICQTRQFDKNFLKSYNDKASERQPLVLGHDTIVMSSWYRDALGGFETTDRDDTTGRVELNVESYNRWLPWAQLRAASHHPDMAVRLGTRLGALGLWLGLLSVALGFISVAQTYAGLVAIIATVVLAAIGAALICGCRGPQRPSQLNGKWI
jgi:hypothetical protein